MSLMRLCNSISATLLPPQKKMNKWINKTPKKNGHGHYGCKVWPRTHQQISHEARADGSSSGGCVQTCGVNGDGQESVWHVIDNFIRGSFICRQWLLHRHRINFYCEGKLSTNMVIPYDWGKYSCDNLNALVIYGISVTPGLYLCYLSHLVSYCNNMSCRRPSWVGPRETWS